MIIIYITCKDKKEGAKISKHLLKKKVVACTNMLPIQSMYWWKGKIESSKEMVLLAKTQNKNFSKIKKEVKKIHSYDVPCITKINADANKEYKAWVRKETK